MAGRSLTALMIVAASVALLSTSCDLKTVVGDIRGEIEGHKPVADAGGNLTAVVETEVELDGSSSYDEDSDPLTYTWKVVGLPSGSTPGVDDVINSSGNRRAYFTPHIEGIFDISLIVSDSKFSTEDVIQIEAVAGVSDNLPPVADAGPDQSGVANSSMHFDGTGSYDPDAGDSIASWAWDFGDGGTATSAAADHTYTSEGTYDVSLTVTDSNGAENIDTLTATVYPQNVNLPPTADITADKSITNGVISGTTSLTVDFDGSSSSDPDTGDSIAAFSWSFGDGSSSTVANPSAITYSPGRYAVKLTVTDTNGASDTAAVTVVVAEATSYKTTVTASEDITVLVDSLQSYPAYNKSTNGIGWTLNALRKTVPVVTLARFDLSNLAGTVVTDATMTVTVVSLDGTPPRDTILAVAANELWSEKTTAFKAVPYTAKTIYGKSLFSGIAKYQFDLTEVIAEFARLKTSKLNIALIPSQSYDAGFYIAAREYGKYPPIINVTYTK